MLNTELRRLQAENRQLKDEVSHANKLVYGTAMAASPALALRPATAPLGGASLSVFSTPQSSSTRPVSAVSAQSAASASSSRQERQRSSTAGASKSLRSRSPKRTGCAACELTENMPASGINQLAESVRFRTPM